MMINNHRLSPKTCAICGTKFLGGSTAKYCPACRAERIRKRDNDRKASEPARRIGNIDNCVLCGKPYTVNGGQQKYCPECSIAETKRRDQESFKRQYADPTKRKIMLTRARHSSHFAPPEIEYK